MSRAALARAADVSYDVLNKIERGDVEQPRGDTLVRIARALGTTEVALKYGNPVDDLKGFPLNEAHTHAEAPLIIAGDVAAGMWMEASLFETEQREETNFLPDRRWPAQAQYMVRVRGESLNKIAQEGDLLLCIDYLASGIEPKNGDLVIVERSRDMGATIERTAKRLIRHNGDIELRPESTDPRFQESVFYREGDPDHTIVTVKAKVISVVKQLE